MSKRQSDRQEDIQSAGQTERVTERQNDSMADSRAANEPALVKCSLPHRPLPKGLWIESPLAVDLTVGLAAVAEEDVKVVRRHLADLTCPDVRAAVL